jgi:hypothetical protein
MAGIAKPIADIRIAAVLNISGSSNRSDFSHRKAPQKITDEPIESWHRNGPVNNIPQKVTQLKVANINISMKNGATYGIKEGDVFIVSTQAVRFDMSSLQEIKLCPGGNARELSGKVCAVFGPEVRLSKNLERISATRGSLNVSRGRRSPTHEPSGIPDHYEF